MANMFKDLYENHNEWLDGITFGNPEDLKIYEAILERDMGLLQQRLDHLKDTQAKEKPTCTQTPEAPTETVAEIPTEDVVVSRTITADGTEIHEFLVSLSRLELLAKLEELGVEVKPRTRDKTLVKMIVEAETQEATEEEITEPLLPEEEKKISDEEAKKAVELVKNFAARHPKASGDKNAKGHEVSEGMKMATDMLAKCGVNRVRNLTPTGLAKLLKMIEKVEKGRNETLNSRSQ